MANQNHDDEILGNETSADEAGEDSLRAESEQGAENDATPGNGKKDKTGKITVTQKTRRAGKQDVDAAKKLALKAGLYDFGMAVESVEANPHDAVEIVAALAHGEDPDAVLHAESTEPALEASSAEATDSADIDLEASAGHPTLESADGNEEFFEEELLADAGDEDDAEESEEDEDEFADDSDDGNEEDHETEEEILEAADEEDDSEDEDFDAENEDEGDFDEEFEDDELEASGETEAAELSEETEAPLAEESNEEETFRVDHEAVDEILSAAVKFTSEEAGVSEAEVLEHQEDAAAELVQTAIGSNPPEENAPFAGVEHDPGIHGELSAEGETGEDGESALSIPFRDLEGADLQGAVEATFFLHHKPIGIAKLRELINPKIKEDDYRTAVSNIMASYWDDSRAIELAEVAGGFQFRTKSQHKDILRRMYQITPMKLTNAMLEVLAIAAYNQPITREGVDRVRGVDSSHLVRVLLDKKMLRIVGKSDEIGRPMLYGTTKEFLEVFGLRDLSSLPSLRDIEDMLPKNEVGVEITEEEMLAKEMEGIVENSKPLEFNDLENDEDLEDTHETQKVQNTAAAPAQTDGHGGAEENGSPEIGSETGGDFHLPDEAAGRLPFGPEGNA